MARPTKDRTGERYGTLTVLKRVENDNKRNARWHCLCDCGERVIAVASRLESGTTKSCKRHHLPPGESALNTLYASYRCEARDKKRIFKLSKKEFKTLTKGNCHYCGQPPAQIQKGYNDYNYIYNGIDRVDNEKGYIPTNVVSCCKMCNLTKRHLPVETFLAWVARIARHQGFTRDNTDT